MALDNIPTLGPGGFNGNLDKVLVYKNGGSEVACSLLTLTNSALNPAGLYLDPVNQRVGIGTTTPTYKFMVSDNSANDGAVFFEKDLLGGQSDCYVYNKNASTNLTTGQLIGTLTFGGYFNSTFSPGSQDVAAIFGQYTGTGTNRKGQLQFRTHDSSGMQSAMTINDTQLVGIGETSPTARLQIKGKGSTSATTSLLVQNSLGNAALTIKDDLTATFGGTAFMNSVYLNQIQSNVASNTALYPSSGGWLFSYDNATSNIQIARLGYQGTKEITASLQVDSTTQGFLPPRMTSAQKNLIASPAAGLMVYDTDLNRPCFHNGSAWVTL